jgi:hypothetical protein
MNLHRVVRLWWSVCRSCFPFSRIGFLVITSLLECLRYRRVRFAYFGGFMPDADCASAPDYIAASLQGGAAQAPQQLGQLAALGILKCCGFHNDGAGVRAFVDFEYQANSIPERIGKPPDVD